jgi:hypothetical protein
VKNHEFEERLRAWIMYMEEQQFSGLTEEVIQTVGGKIYYSLGVVVQDCLKLSRGWLNKFQKRHGLKHFRFHGEAASASLLDVEADRARIVEILSVALQQGYVLEDIYNMDKTSFFMLLLRNPVLHNVHG